MQFLVLLLLALNVPRFGEAFTNCFLSDGRLSAVKGRTLFQEKDTSAIKENSPEENTDIAGILQQDNALKKTISALKDDNAALKDDNAALNAKIDAVLEDNAALNKKIDAVLKDTAALDKNLNEKIDALKDDNAALKDDNASLKDDNAALDKNLNEKIDALKDDNAALKDDNAALKDDNAALDKNLNEKIDALNKRIDGIVGAFAPATTYSLMETAVYEFVARDEKTNYAAAQAASRVMCLLTGRKNNTNPLGSGALKDKTTSLDICLKSLGGLVAFIQNEHIEMADLQSWSPECDPFVHDGPLLDALYGNPTAASIRKTPAQVKSMRAAFASEKLTFQGFCNVTTGVDAVLDALAKKGLNPTDSSKLLACTFLNKTYRLPAS